jgi:hypothetical protein
LPGGHTCHLAKSSRCANPNHHRPHKGRLQLFATDRLLWVWLYRIWPRVLNAMVLVKPATVIQWNRKGFRLYWRWRSGSRHLGRSKTSTEIRDLIRQMSLANPLWGAPRVPGELLMLGIEVSQATVGRYMPWRPKVPSPTCSRAAVTTDALGHQRSMTLSRLNGPPYAMVACRRCAPYSQSLP